MNGTWNHQLELFITPCLVLLDFIQFDFFCTNFANTHKKSHKKTMCWLETKILFWKLF